MRRFFIEAMMIFGLSTVFFFLLSCVVWFLVSKLQVIKDKRLFLKVFSVLSGFMIIVQFLGSIVWEFAIKDRFVKEADPWISFLTFRPLMWERVFEELPTTFHDPLGPFYTTGQVATLYFGLAILFILIGALIPGVALTKKMHEQKNDIFIITSLFLFGQFLWLGLLSIISL